MRFDENDLTMEKTKQELYMDINEASQRSNVDSAKKRACLQHMDYDGFRQMVLGANLFPLKQGEASNIYHERNKGQNINHTASYQMKNNEPGYDESIVKNTLEINLDEELAAPKNQEEFEKFVTKKCRESLQRYTYMRLINFEHFGNIFTGSKAREFDPELLRLLIMTFKE